MWKNAILGTFNVNKAIWAFQKFCSYDDIEDETEENADNENKNAEEEEKQEKEIEQEQIEDSKLIEQPSIENIENNNQILIVEGDLDKEFTPRQPKTAHGPRARQYSRKLQRVYTAKTPDYESLDEKIRESFEEIDRMLLEFQNGETQLEQVQVNKMKKLIQKQRMELLEHNSDWKSGLHYKMYHRDSQFLRNLKNQYQLLVRMNMEDDANLLRKQIEDVSLHEQETNKKDHTFAFYKSRTELLERQKRERENAMHAAAEKKNAYRAKRAKNTEILNRRYAILKDVGIRSSRQRLPKITQ